MKRLYRIELPSWEHSDSVLGDRVAPDLRQMTDDRGDALQ